MAKGSSPDGENDKIGQHLKEENNGEDKYKENRESLVTQWLGLCVSTAGAGFWSVGTGSQPCESGQK